MFNNHWSGVVGLVAMVFSIISYYFLASGEAILGTQRYFSKHFTVYFFSRLRRGDFRYTTILFKAFSYYCFLFASGEAILGTQRYFSKHFLIKWFFASGEAISGTQRYFSKHVLIIVCFRLRRGDFRYTTIRFKAISTSKPPAGRF